MIPKKIHYCWYGKNEYSDVILKCMKSWELHLKGYEFIIWNETNTPFEQFDFLDELYKRKKWSFISDYMRLYSLYHHGGIYLDTDIEIIKPFEDLLNETSFIGFQTSYEKSRFPVGAGVIGSVKNNPMIEDLLKLTEIKQKLTFHPVGGPFIISPYLKSKGLTGNNNERIGNMRILPPSSFYPFYMDEVFSIECIKEETYCIHWWEDSWSIKKRNVSYRIMSFISKLKILPKIIFGLFIFVTNRNNFFHFKRLIK